MSDRNIKYFFALGGVKQIWSCVVFIQGSDGPGAENVKEISFICN